MQRRVAITGMGVISPLGNDVDTMFARLTAGESAVRRLDTRRCEGLRCSIGASVDFDGATHFDGARLRMLDRVSQMALAASGQAIASLLGEQTPFSLPQPHRLSISLCALVVLLSQALSVLISNLQLCT